jgi:hypothetical protein
MVDKRFACLAAIVSIWLVSSSLAATITFDFDTAVPALAPGVSTPFIQTSGGVTAVFSSPSDVMAPAFSIQNAATTFYTLSLLSGNYVWPNTVQRVTLEIQFDQLLTGMSLAFATIEYHDPAGAPSNIQLTAYRDSPASLVGTTMTHGNPPGSDTYPQGILSFDSAGQPFNLVEIVVPFQTEGATGFLADNITITTGSTPPGAIPEPASLFLCGAGLLVLGALVRRLKR